MTRSVVLLLTISFIVTPLISFAGANTSSLKVAGWVPYWKNAEGVADATNNLSHLDTVNPFGFVVRSDGTLRDMSNLATTSWQTLIKKAHEKNVEIIPSVMWSDGNQMHRMLASSTLRRAHEDAIVGMVHDGGYEGVDIDYESKLAETKDHFSLFLKELKSKLGTKVLSCTLEPRIPPSSLYRVVPKHIAYANDYPSIGTYCDRIVLMAYDQGRSDLLLDSARRGQPYMPIADPDWVRKVIKLALRDIPKEKIMLGVPTYGYEFEVTVEPDWFKSYKLLRSRNPADIPLLATANNATSSRNSARELSLTYQPTTTPYVIPKNTVIPKSTPKGNIAAAEALAYANRTGKTVTFRMVSYSDASAIADKVALAKEYGLRGIALFKLDGGEDQKLWNAL